MKIKNNQRVRLGIILVFASVVASMFFFRNQPSVLADDDNILNDLKSYRTWKKITKTPIEVRVTTDSPSAFTIDTVDGGG